MRLMALIITAIIGISIVAACQPTALPAVPQSAAEHTTEQDTQRIGIIFEGVDSIISNHFCEVPISVK